MSNLEIAAKKYSGITYDKEDYEEKYFNGSGCDKYDAFLEGAKWQAKRMYSEEEIKKIAFNFYYDMSHKMGVSENLISENATNVDVWFEQFKKK